MNAASNILIELDDNISIEFEKNNFSFIVYGLPVNDYDWELRVLPTAYYATYANKEGEHDLCEYDEGQPSAAHKAADLALMELQEEGEMSENGKKALLSFIESVYNDINFH